MSYSSAILKVPPLGAILILCPVSLVSASAVISARVPLGRSSVDIVIILHLYITLRVLIIKKSLPSPRPIGNTGLLHHYMRGVGLS